MISTIIKEWMMALPRVGKQQQLVTSLSLPTTILIRRWQRTAAGEEIDHLVVVATDIVVLVNPIIAINIDEAAGRIEIETKDDIAVQVPKIKRIIVRRKEGRLQTTTTK